MIVTHVSGGMQTRARDGSWAGAGHGDAMPAGVNIIWIFTNLNNYGAALQSPCDNDSN